MLMLNEHCTYTHTTFPRRQVFRVALEKSLELHITTTLDDTDFAAHLPQTLQRISQAFRHTTGPVKKHKTQLLLHAIVVLLRLMVLANVNDHEAAAIFEDMKQHKDQSLAAQIKAAKGGGGKMKKIVYTNLQTRHLVEIYLALWEKLVKWDGEYDRTILFNSETETDDSKKARKQLTKPDHCLIAVLSATSTVNLYS